MAGCSYLTPGMLLLLEEKFFLSVTHQLSLEPVKILCENASTYRGRRKCQLLFWDNLCKTQLSNVGDGDDRIKYI